MNNNTVIGIIVAAIVVVGIIVYMLSGDVDILDTENQNQLDENNVTNQTAADDEEDVEADASAPNGTTVGGAVLLPSRDIISNAVLASNISTAVEAIEAAGLVGTLQGPGPFTVFIPNNAAFEKLPSMMVNTLMNSDDTELLTDVLTYHVVMGEYTTADLTNNQELITVQGEIITVSKSAAGSLSINGSAQVETADVISSNGVIFIINSVLVPEDVN